MKIRPKLLCSFLAFAGFMSVLALLAFLHELSSAKRAAIHEGEQLAAAIADSINFDRGNSAPSLFHSTQLQQYVTSMHNKWGRDVFILDLNKRILADADPAEVENLFNDPSGSVDATLQDGIPRTFVETIGDKNIRQVVIRLQDENRRSIGGIILEYSSSYMDIMAPTRQSFALLIGTGLGCLGLATAFAVWLAKHIARPLEMLASDVSTFDLSSTGLRGHYSNDEIGAVAQSFCAVAATWREAHDKVQASEQRYRWLIASIPEVVWTADLSGNMPFVSSRMRQMLGYSPDEFELKGAPLWFDRIHPEDKQRVLDAYKAMFQNGTPYDVQCRVQRNNGEWLWVHDRAMVNHDMNGAWYATGLLSDITERKQSERVVKTLASIAEFSNEAIIGITPDGLITGWNRAAQQIYGYTAEEVLGRSSMVIVPPHKISEFHHNLAKINSGQAVEQIETQRVTKSGTVLDISLSVAPIRGSDGRIVGASSIALDITARKRIFERLRLHSAAMDAAANAILITDAKGVILSMNPAFTQLTGYLPEEAIGLTPGNILKSGKHDKYFYEQIWSTILAGKIWKGELTNRKKNGQHYREEMTISPVCSETGEITHFIAVKQDITERKRAQEEAQFFAYYDPLTRLANRHLMQDRLQQAIASARRLQLGFAVLFVDLDGFKTINDSLGHSVGDRLLKVTAARLKKCAREQDTVARIGGDEFVVILAGASDEVGIAAAANRIRDAVSAECSINGHSLHVGCSIGISLFPRDGKDVESLIKNADTAMYAAKDSGRNRFSFFTTELNAQVVERLLLENSLRTAIKNEEFFLVYQPQFNIATNKVVALETLIRWQHPRLGLISPNRFIPVAESTGLIMEIGAWVLRTACAQFQEWRRQGLSNMSIAVNVSGKQFRHEDFPDVVAGVLAETGLPAEFLELELTESQLMSNPSQTLVVLERLRAMGLSLAIDDFGTGYSSLSYLKQFSVSRLKIDHSFVRDLGRDPDCEAITAAIIRMAKAMNLGVVAEGLETEEQLAFLRSHQCDDVQGYHFSKPLTSDKVIEAVQALQAPAAECITSGSVPGKSGTIDLGRKRENKCANQKVSL